MSPLRALVAAVALLAGLLGLGAGPVSDDHVLDIAVRAGPGPVGLFDGGLPAESWGFLRPTGLRDWWLETRVLGLDARGLGITQAALHAGCALLTASLAQRLGASPGA